MARGAPAVLRLIRLPGCLTASADSATAVLVASAASGLTAGGLELLAAAVASFGLYAYGIVLGDLLDVEKDRRLHPHRPLPADQVSRERARLVAGVALLTALGTAALAGRHALAFAVATAALVTLHQRVLRRSDLAACFGMAGCRVLNLFLGAAIAGATLPTLIPVATGVYVFSLTGVSAYEERRSRGELTLLAILLLTAILLPFPAFRQRGFPLVTAAPLFLILTWHAARARAARSPATVGKLVGHAVAGLLLLDAAYLFGFAHAGAAVGLVVIYMMLRYGRRAGLRT